MKRSERSIKHLIGELKSGAELSEESRRFLVQLLRNQFSDTSLSRQSWQLNERIKELKCLYAMMDLLYRNRNDIDSVLHDAVKLIPAGYAFPSETHVRLELGNQSYVTDAFTESEWSMSAILDLAGPANGLLTVYVEYKPGDDWLTPFLEEEYELMDMLAKLIAGFYGQYHVLGLLSEKEEYLYMFRLGIEYSEEAIFITDKDGNIIFVNAAFSRIYGYSEAEVLGKNPRILKSGIKSDEFYKSMWETLLAGEIASGEIVNRRKDGNLITLEYSSNPIVNREGKLIGFLAIQHDISERKLMEEQLREYEQKLRDVVENSTNLFYSHSSDGIITYASPHTEQYFGVNLDGTEISWTDFITDHPVNKKAFDYTE